MFNRKKEGFTGSAVTIKGEDLKKYSTNNVAKAIAAVAPGLRIMDNINMGSNPNGLPDMRMRGSANMDLNAQATVDLNSASNDVLAVQGEYERPMPTNRCLSWTDLKSVYRHLPIWIPIVLLLSFC